MTEKKKGLEFFKFSDREIIFKKYHLNDLPEEERRCIVCGEILTKDNLGGLLPGSVRGVCNKFSCIMAVLLKEKKEMVIKQR